MYGGDANTEFFLSTPERKRQFQAASKPFSTLNFLGAFQGLPSYSKYWVDENNRFRRQWCPTQRQLKPGELHVPCHNFSGPGTDTADAKVRFHNPFNGVDACSRQHDFDYETIGRLKLPEEVKHKMAYQADLEALSCYDKHANDYGYDMARAGIYAKTISPLESIWGAYGTPLDEKTLALFPLSRKNFKRAQQFYQRAFPEAKALTEDDFNGPSEMRYDKKLRSEVPKTSLWDTVRGSKFSFGSGFKRKHKGGGTGPGGFSRPSAAQIRARRLFAARFARKRRRLM